MIPFTYWKLNCSFTNALFLIQQFTMTLKAGTTGSTGKHRNQTCRCTFSSYYCTRKPDYYRLNSRWSLRENFDVTKERKPRSCSTGFSPCRSSTVKKRSPSINYWRSAARFTAASNDLTQGRFDNSLTLYLLCYFVYL